MRRALLILTMSLAAGVVASANWPAWRGPAGDGVSAEKNLPVKWSPTENIAWKLQLPQWSGATPVIWGDMIFLNVAEADGNNLSLWAVSRSKGDVLWKRPLSTGNNKQRKQNMSSPSPVTDGTTVWIMTGTGIPARVRLQGHRALDARHPEGLRPLRAQLGLRQFAAAPSRATCSCRCCTG